jgi:hypothetical protein
MMDKGCLVAVFHRLSFCSFVLFKSYNIQPVNTGAIIINNPAVKVYNVSIYLPYEPPATNARIQESSAFFILDLLFFKLQKKSDIVVRF